MYLFTLYGLQLFTKLCQQFNTNETGFQFSQLIAPVLSVTVMSVHTGSYTVVHQSQTPCIVIQPANDVRGSVHLDEFAVVLLRFVFPRVLHLASFQLTIPATCTLYIIIICRDIA